MSFSLIVYAGRRLPLHGISNKISNAQMMSTIMSTPELCLDDAFSFARTGFHFAAKRSIETMRALTYDTSQY
jgi:hypothetical protein